MAASSKILSDAEWGSIGELLQLSGRELEITRLIFDGHKELSIARELGVAKSTVHTHIRRMFGKLGLHDQRDLVLCVFAAHRGVAGKP